MASIQVLEISPLEYEVEELSSDMVGSIWGGQDDSIGFASLLECTSRFLGDIGRALDNGNPTGVLFAVEDYLDCVARRLNV